MIDHLVELFAHPVGLIAGGVFAFYGFLLLAALFWRHRTQRQIEEADLERKDYFELSLSIDSEIVRLVGGSTVVLGVLLATGQFLETIRLTTQSVVNVRMADAYGLLFGEDDVERLAGVYSLASVADLDSELETGIYETLFALLRNKDKSDDCRRPAISPGRCPSTGISELSSAVISVYLERNNLNALGRRISLRQVNLSLGRMERVDFRGADLSGADLSGATLKNARLDSADLYDAQLYDASLDGVQARGANMPGANLTKARLRESPWGTVRSLSRVVGLQSVGGPARFDNANLSGALLYGASACNAHFNGSSLRDAKLDGVVAYQANFSGADITRASFQNARLSGADFRGAKFDRSSLRPDFTCAVLGESRVTHNELCGSPQLDSVLRSVLPPPAIPAAMVSDEFLGGVTLCGTILPDGTNSNRDCPTSGPAACKR